MKYILIEWPDSQYLTDYEWFISECSLADAELFGSSAYFVPEERWEQLLEDDKSALSK